MPDNGKPEQDIETQRLIENALAVRQYAIGLTIETERLLKSLNRPVDSAIVPRRNRRGDKDG